MSQDQLPQILQTIFQGITAFTIVFAVVQSSISRKQLHLTTITKCIGDFRGLGDMKLQTTDIELINKYVDLVNEELFYFQHKYIPIEVSKEWIDGMIDYIPITNAEMKVLNKDNCLIHLRSHRMELLKNFPRIQNAFEIKDSYDFELIYSKNEKQRILRVKERKKLIKEILKNIKLFDWYD